MTTNLDELYNNDENDMKFVNNLRINKNQLLIAREKMRVSDELYKLTFDEIMRLILMNDDEPFLPPQKQTWYTKLNKNSYSFEFDTVIDYRRLIMLFYDMAVEEFGLNVDWVQLFNIVELFGGNYLDEYDGSAYYKNN